MLNVKRTMMIMLLSLMIPALACAGEIKTEVIYPKDAIPVVGGQSELALWVEDGRKETVFGRAVDGEYLVSASDVAASLYAHMTSSLKAAGYQVVPFNPDHANGMLVRIQSITYSSEREMFKSKVGVKVALEVKMNSSDVTRTYRAAVEQQFALSPSPEENGSTIGNGLSTAAAAALADLKLAEANPAAE
ncbi:hypothetical protein MMIC_P0561 [Mariprofundus micogutta]|uniref:Lipoprotein n=1 Tax=Mariprofundus micogutta TaxID=1921010 RepID=A0A1L8CL32_9PROT|nr:YajG family lipoprotein [Mariprofundus micogutta]GAV19613.1 hypothetical protein MMIC_P0561 [Mariprofundus micogutta]